MNTTRSLLVLLFLIPGLSVWGADVGELTAVCESCHGPNGVSGHNDIPNIAGQPEAFINRNLKEYRSWGRPCVRVARRYGEDLSETNMCNITANMTDDDFSALAAHYSKLPWVSADQEFDPKLAAEGKNLHLNRCDSCHEDGGTGVEGSEPRLVGQWTFYLRKGMKFIPTGEHLVPPMMEKKIDELSDAELDALMAYYASDGQ